ncbi:MAG: CheR family methyltransferase [Pseudomonadota bacterium]
MALPLTVSDSGDASLSADDLKILARIADTEAGLCLTEGHVSHIEGRLRGRMNDLGLPDLTAYCRYLDAEGGAEERKHYIHHLLTHTTSFFRDVAQHDWLALEGMQLLFDSNPGRVEPLQIWSAACSSGEELYSALILAADASERMSARWMTGNGIGTDISSDVIEKAQTAVYTREAIATMPEELRPKYLLQGKRDPDSIRVVPEIRGRAKWQLANLTRPETYAFCSADLVLLRNVLIYFSNETQQQVMGNVVARMRPGGILLTGPNESTLARATGLSTIRPTIYRKDPA